MSITAGMEFSLSYFTQCMLKATELDEFQNGQPKSLERGILPRENPYVVPYNQKFEIPEKLFILGKLLKNKN